MSKFIFVLEIDKTLYKRRRNARVHSLVSPYKSALVVFYELFRGVTIEMEERRLLNGMVYTATIEVR